MFEYVEINALDSTFLVTFDLKNDQVYLNLVCMPKCALQFYYV